MSILCDARQWMAAGDRGATGVCVTRLVEEDTRPEHVSAIDLSMAAWPALAPPSSTGRVTPSRVPVSIAVLYAPPCTDTVDVVRGETERGL